MEKIASFTVNHELLEPGVYVSRRDTYPNTSYEVTTFDIRMCAPNREPVIDTAALHALEHMGPRICAITKHGRRVFYILALWAAEQVFTFYCLAHIKRKMLLTCCASCFQVWLHMRAQFQELYPKNVVTGMIVICLWQNGGQSVFLSKRCFT